MIVVGVSELLKRRVSEDGKHHAMKGVRKTSSFNGQKVCPDASDSGNAISKDSGPEAPKDYTLDALLFEKEKDSCHAFPHHLLNLCFGLF